MVFSNLFQYVKQIFLNFFMVVAFGMFAILPLNYSDQRNYGTAHILNPKFIRKDQTLAGLSKGETGLVDYIQGIFML